MAGAAAIIATIVASVALAVVFLALLFQIGWNGFLVPALDLEQVNTLQSIAATLGLYGAGTAATAASRVSKVSIKKEDS